MSRQTFSLFIVIVSMQACLLSVDARRLRVAKQSTAVSQSSSTNSTTTSCSPHHSQLKYYNELYSISIANNFNGNILYYALKAVETDNNRTKVGIEELEDNEIIASISDHNRFTPAGMQTANKAVCAKILQEMDEEASLFSTTALCAWDYICDYRADRFPHYLFKARCKTSKCSGNCNSQGSNKHNMCQSHGIHVTILETRDNCGEWVWGQELLPIACTCTNDVMMRAERIVE